MYTITEVHDNIVKAWRAGEEQTLYNIIDVNKNGTITKRMSIMETTFDPHGSEERLRSFLAVYANKLSQFSK